eukprot:CAMPEP_0116141722 /NCGR_PEP_ID=MMETSP0329-20121206/14529_1 /TAXON_ID=697910 /ORGANISM="Pseudo-nitzschia arenysensis, Strain B593" /LENGTH=239 /DNA_ID=CAMNT_0003636915 /DNA_START=120 /DNA_END=839 /DNA_ORIENTATION=-
MSAAAAAKTILSAAAPGQFDSVAQHLQTLGCSGNFVGEAQKELWDFECKTMQNSLDHPMAKALHESMQEYQKKNFSKPNIEAKVFVTSSSTGGSDSLTVHSYAERIDAVNQHSGCWKATWNINTLGSGQAEISGKVYVKSYAYEEGNIQLKIDKEFPATTVKGSDLVGALVQQITSWETIILGILASMNDEVSSEHLRSIRRVLPITKTKMNWDAIAHRSVKTLKQTAPETRSKVKYNN